MYVCMYVYLKTATPNLFLNKAEELKPAILFKKRLWHSYFPVNFEKSLEIRH